MLRNPVTALSPADLDAAYALGKSLERTGTYASAAPLSGKGQLRVIQAYLRVFGYFGNPEDVPGSAVVTGSMNPRTQAAMNAFFQDHGAAFGLIRATANDAMLNALRAYNMQVTQSVTGGAPEATREMAYAFAERSLPNRTTLAKLHPLMRFPLAAALRELESQGVAITIHEAYRDPKAQEGLVASGKSTAPPNWSFHNYGLAVDIAPRAKTLAEAYDKDSNAWKAIFRVMKRYGFDSMYKNKGWDLPHFELPMKTPRMQALAVDADGWKIIPEKDIPSRWKSINREVVKGVSAADTTQATPVLAYLLPPLRDSISR